MERDTFYYRPTVNGIALKTLLSPLDVPDFRLGIGEAENLTPQPLIIYTDYVHGSDYSKVIRPSIGQTAYEDVNPDRQGQILSLDDFDTTSFWLGGM